MSPNNSKTKKIYQQYYYKEGIFTYANISNRVHIINNTKINFQYNKEQCLDESFMYKYHIKYNDGTWSYVDRKHIYFEDEYQQLITDINNLNDILAFKRKQKILLDNYIEQINKNKDWNFNNFELKRNKI